MKFMDAVSIVVFVGVTGYAAYYGNWQGGLLLAVFVFGVLKKQYGASVASFIAWLVLLRLPI